MSDFVHALGAHGFLQRALIAGILASIGCGIMGTYVVVRRLGYLAGGIAHAVLGGMGIAFFLGYSPMIGAICAALIAALAIGWISLRHQDREDTLIGALWAMGMALGILFISRTPGYNVDLMSYLFGNILLVSDHDLLFMAVLDVVIVAVISLRYQQFLAVVFDEEFARVRGLNTEFYFLLLLCLIALTVVLLIQLVGLILVIALLTLPAAIAAQWIHRLCTIMVIAALLGMLFTSFGIGISYGSDLPSGACIVLVTGISYFVTTLIRDRWVSKHRAINH